MKLPVYVPRSAPPGAWQPLGDRLLVKRLGPAAVALLNHAQERFIVPSVGTEGPTAYEDCEWGIVIARGESRGLESVPGDLVLFKDWTAHQALNLGEYAIIQEADVRLRRRN